MLYTVMSIFTLSGVRTSSSSPSAYSLPDLAVAMLPSSVSVQEYRSGDAPNPRSTLPCTQGVVLAHDRMSSGL